MKTLRVLSLFLAVSLFGTLSSEAHILVYRMRLSGPFTRENEVGKVSGSTWSSTQSMLWFLDLDTDCWIESSTQGTSGLTIMLDERQKTSRTPAAKTFSYSKDAGEDVGTEHRVVHKFEFYSNRNKFYYFYFQTEDLGPSGFDTGSLIAQGACRKGVNIGGGLRSANVPSDFAATIKRGDDRTFKSGVLSFKFDATITAAVNDYLNAKSIKSVKGSGISVALPAATRWLTETYLPGQGFVSTP
jgi:hypothetical protein